MSHAHATPPVVTAAQVEDLSDAAFLTGADGVIAVWNSAAGDLLGYDAAAVTRQRCADLLDGIGPGGAHVCAMPCPLLLALRGAERVAAHPDMVARRADGERVRLSVMAMRVSSGGVPMLLHQLRDEPLSERDPLTATLSRHALLVRLLDEQSRSQRSRTPLTLAMIDIDGLKAINDAYGHAAGDRVLIAVARTLRQGRRSDLIGRWGGDEFVVLLPDTDPEDAAPRLCRTLDEFARGQEAFGLRASFSAGVVEVVARAPIHSVMARADAALYRAKRSGRGRVVREPGIELTGRASATTPR